MPDSLFHEIYGIYFAVVKEILSHSEPMTMKEIEQIIHEKGFNESSFLMAPSLQNQQSPWYLLQEADDNKWKSVTHHPTPIIQTNLERQWLKTVLLDARLPFFIEQVKIDELKEELVDVQPLFDLNTVTYYDQFSQTETQIAIEQQYMHSRILIRAIQHEQMVQIDYQRQSNQLHKKGNFLPVRLDYSPKNNLFRLKAWRIQRRSRFEVTLNLNRMLSVKTVENKKDFSQHPITSRSKEKQITCQLVDRRKALQRSMLHFADYRKTTRRLDDYLYELTITYDQSDETELLIRVLSFGPFIKVLSPTPFVEKITERINHQQLLMNSLIDSNE